MTVVYMSTDDIYQLFLKFNVTGGGSGYAAILADVG
jgi:hypothetical protein